MLTRKLKLGCWRLLETPSLLLYFRSKQNDSTPYLFPSQKKEVFVDFHVQFFEKIVGTYKEVV